MSRCSHSHTCKAVTEPAPIMPKITLPAPAVAGRKDEPASVVIQTTQVASPVAGLERNAGGARREGTSNLASRSREEIELVFDRNKGAIFALYNRALRNDPTLEGKLVLRLTIAPTGEVRSGVVGA